MEKHTIILTKEDRIYLSALVNREKEKCLMPAGIAFLSHLYIKIRIDIGICSCDECKKST